MGLATNIFSEILLVGGERNKTMDHGSCILVCIKMLSLSLIMILCTRFTALSGQNVWQLFGEHKLFLTQNEKGAGFAK